jgi:hypothetical protein
MYLREGLLPKTDATVLFASFFSNPLWVGKEERSKFDGAGER